MRQFLSLDRNYSLFLYISVPKKLPQGAVICYDRRHMNRKFFFLLSLIGAVIIIVALVRFFVTRGPKEGELRVDSDPTATVFLDNKNLGKTPFRDKVTSGSYTVKIVPDSTSTQLTAWEGKITIGQSLLTYVNANLSDSELTTAVDVVWLEKITSKQSELSVTTNPDGATVLVDDIVKGSTPVSIQDIVAGDHSVAITSTGFSTRTLKIKTTSGYRLIADLKLALAPGSSNPQASVSAAPVQVTSSGSTPTPTSKPTQKTATSSATQTADPPKPFVLIKDTPTGFLRVRIDPSTGATESGRVNPGEKFTIVDSQNGWYEITFDGKNTGWVSGQYAQKVE